MLTPPPEIVVIFEKPGLDWTGDEKGSVVQWLNSEPQLTELRLYGLHRLGFLARREDAEDAWGDFYLPRLVNGAVRSELDVCIRGFDPEWGSFRTWLLVCFKHFCYRQAKKLGPLPGDQGESGELGFSPDDQEPPDSWEMIRDCLQALQESAPKHWEAVTLDYFDEYSVLEIAEKLGISESLVKIRLYRGRKTLRDCLEKKGFKP